MFRSVFAKYVFAFAFVILISFSLLSLLTSAMLSSYLEEQRKADVLTTAETVADITTFSLYELTGGSRPVIARMPVDKTEHISELFASFTNNRPGLILFLSDTEGKIVAISDDQIQTEDVAVPASILKTILEDEEYLFFGGSLNGFLSRDMMAAAYPLTVPEDDDMFGIVFACTTAYEEQILFNIFHKNLIMASVWVMLAALVAGYFISDYMSSPLRKMISASKQYAKGNFDARVPIVGHDEIAELSEAFNDMAENLSDLEKMRNTFLCDTAHDLRTPMTTISGFIDGINSGAIPPEKQSHYLNIISTEIHRLSQLVSQILEVSRYEAGRRKFNGNAFDICETVRLVLISFEQKIEEKKLDVAFEAEEDYISVFADKGAIYQVVYNLCDNAIKFSREGGLFSVRIVKKDMDRAAVTVYNEGCGIPEEDIPFIFSRFYKSDKSRGQDRNGFGVGLFIVKSIIDGHRQKITVDSKEGEYCSFTFTLPLYIESPKENDKNRLED